MDDITHHFLIAGLASVGIASIFMIKSDHGKKKHAFLYGGGLGLFLIGFIGICGQIMQGISEMDLTIGISSIAMVAGGTGAMIKALR